MGILDLQGTPLACGRLYEALRSNLSAIQTLMIGPGLDSCHVTRYDIHDDQDVR